MRVRFLVQVSGPYFEFVPGEEYDLPDELALKYADGVRAELVEPPSPIRKQVRRGGQDAETTEISPRERRAS